MAAAYAVSQSWVGGVGQSYFEPGWGSYALQSGPAFGWSESRVGTQPTGWSYAFLIRIQLLIHLEDALTLNVSTGLQVWHMQARCIAATVRAASELNCCELLRTCSENGANNEAQWLILTSLIVAGLLCVLRFCGI